VFGYYKNIASNYILNQLELEAKGYGIKKFITNFMNQLSYTLDAIKLLEYINQGRGLLLLVTQQNLKLSSWHI
jgi:hypothetical protein